MGLWGELDEAPGVRLLYGLRTRGDPEFAVDGFDLGSYRARGNVEVVRYLPSGELADKEAKHFELALRKLPVELPFPRLTRAKHPFLTLEELGEDAGIGISLQKGPRLGEYRPSFGSIATHGVYLRERQQPDESGPGTQAGQPSSRRKTTLQLLLGFLKPPAFCESTSECDGRQTSLGNPIRP